jgi:hypothetical protein
VGSRKCYRAMQRAGARRSGIQPLGGETGASARSTTVPRFGTCRRHQTSARHWWNSKSLKHPVLRDDAPWNPMCVDNGEHPSGVQNANAKEQEDV